MAPGKPTQNGFIEFLNGRHLFIILPEARKSIEAWRIDYNTKRPNSSLGGLTPTEFAPRPDQKLNRNRLSF
jgi:putative transposase